MSPYLLTAGVQGAEPPGRRLRSELRKRPEACKSAKRVGMRAAALLLAALCCLGTGPVAAAPAMRALVVGIDRYEELPILAGAVNDARDIAQALREAGATDLTLLENEAATRARVTAEWGALAARAAPGDTLVLTYAGHGGQEPARVPATERDGLDETLLLGGFRSSGAGTRERIFDDELHRWFRDAGDRGLKVIFVADSCHSGTLTRSLDPRAPKGAMRNAQYTIADDMLDLELPADLAVPDDAALAHVSFLAAGQEHEQVPEVALPGAGGTTEPRGALSYMFARALEGKADADGDGALRRSELWRFVRENVRMASEARQTPNLQPAGAGDDPVLLTRSSARPPSGGQTADADPLRLAILHAEPATVAKVRELLPGARVAPAGDAPDLIWDAAAGQAVTGHGDVAAHGVDLDALPAVAAKWEAVRTVRTLSESSPLKLRVHPHDGLHREGAEIEVVADGLNHRRLTLIGLSGNGVVHYLYPLATDPAHVEVGKPFRLRLAVTPPFGADHVVAVSAESPLDALNAELGRLDGKPAVRRAAQLLAEAAAEAQGWQSAIQGLFTAP